MKRSAYRITSEWATDRRLWYGGVNIVPSSATAVESPLIVCVTRPNEHKYNPRRLHAAGHRAKENKRLCLKPICD
jgi:hypothetical protein